MGFDAILGGVFWTERCGMGTDVCGAATIRKAAGKRAANSLLTKSQLPCALLHRFD